eukprot:CAMPEP_0184708136 /NCGR_PEP_ID=MMETSP0313-20130426/37625_1 /TAXON_ID=2792 /ORGANISM="Porphyridium aerugineum, Strain SAG 1380-2" /LENGTH=98 /DNA_ID=CAMNT_0027169719 /DNA_START=479 /DNA_END=775 /DNA_ORIENTATION=-
MTDVSGYRSELYTLIVWLYPYSVSGILKVHPALLDVCACAEWMMSENTSNKAGRMIDHDDGIKALSFMMNEWMNGPWECIRCKRSLIPPESFRQCNLE